MADYNARVLPFINTVAYVTAKAGIYPSGGYHSGIDLATTGNDPLYAICDCEIIGKGYQAGGYGNFVIFKDLNSDYAFLYGHMRDPSPFNIGDRVRLNQQIGIEGATGNVTGIHVHVEMQNYVQNGNTWISNPSDSSLWGTVYLPATDYMGFPNDLGISVIYNGAPVPYIPRKKKKFPWVLVIGKKRRLIN